VGYQSNGSVGFELFIGSDLSLPWTLLRNNIDIGHVSPAENQLGQIDNRWGENHPGGVTVQTAQSAIQVEHKYDQY
jgi:hypothetical protein